MAAPRLSSASPSVSRPADAMLDTGRHEQAHRARHGLGADRPHDAGVIRERVGRRHHGVVPAMPQDQLAAALDEAAQVGVLRVERGRHAVAGQPLVPFDAELRQFPARVVQNQVAEEADRRFDEAALAGPVAVQECMPGRLGAARQGIGTGAAGPIGLAVVEPAHARDLLGTQAPLARLRALQQQLKKR
jgi:hypothetical protein